MHVLQERLKDLRIENGYKQEDIAKKLNISTSAYGYYEQGRNEPSIETLREIANTYDVSTDYLLGLIDAPKPQTMFKIDEDLILTKEELVIIKEMKKSSLLEDFSHSPKSHREKLYRYWEFMKDELKLGDKEI